MYDQCEKIVNSVSFEDLTPEQSRLLDEMSKIAWIRAIDIFSSVVGQLAHHDDGIAKLFWYTRLVWFIQEIRQMCWQFLEEQRIYDQKGKSWKQKEKEASKFYKKHWRKVFTPESFNEIWEECFDKAISSN